MALTDKLTAIADAIRLKTGKTDSLTLDRMPTEIASIEAGAEDTFWDAVQAGGERANYEGAFTYWDVEYIRPKHKVVPTAGRTYQMFMGNESLKKVERAYFDLSQCAVSQTANAHYYTFDGCRALEELEDIGIQAGYYNGTWRRCNALHTIALVRFQEDTKIANAFQYCNALENLTIEGTIGQDGLNVSWSPLTHASLMSILDALKDYSGTGTTHTVTLGAINLAKLTDTEKQLATEKGWTLA